MKIYLAWAIIAGAASVPVWVLCSALGPQAILFLAAGVLGLSALIWAFHTVIEHQS